MVNPHASLGGLCDLTGHIAWRVVVADDDQPTFQVARLDGRFSAPNFGRTLPNHLGVMTGLEITEVAWDWRTGSVELFFVGPVAGFPHPLIHPDLLPVNVQNGQDLGVVCHVLGFSFGCLLQGSIPDQGRSGFDVSVAQAGVKFGESGWVGPNLVHIVISNLSLIGQVNLGWALGSDLGFGIAWAS